MRGLDDRGDLAPRRLAIEAHADPSEVRDVGRQEVEIRPLSTASPARHPCGAPQARGGIAVVIVEEVNERALVVDQERRRAHAAARWFSGSDGTALDLASWDATSARS